MTTTTIDTAAIARNVRAEAAAMYDRMADSATYTARELGTRKWMLDSLNVWHTPTTVVVEFGRGSEYLANTMGTSLIDGATLDLPLEVGRIDVTGPRRLTFTL